MTAFNEAIRKHPVGMKPKIGKGSASPPKSAPDKATSTSFRLLPRPPFNLKAEVLNQQGRLITIPTKKKRCLLLGSAFFGVDN
jgi:hypothetical protein